MCFFILQKNVFLLFTVCYFSFIQIWMDVNLLHSRQRVARDLVYPPADCTLVETDNMRVVLIWQTAGYFSCYLNFGRTMNVCTPNIDCWHCLSSWHSCYEVTTQTVKKSLCALQYILSVTFQTNISYNCSTIEIKSLQIILFTNFLNSLRFFSKVGMTD